MSLELNIKFAREVEQVSAVMKYLNKTIEEPKIKSTFPELWNTMLDIYIILDE